MSTTKEIIQTQRLVLRTWSHDDIDAFAELIADPDVMRYFPSTQTREHAKEFIDRQIELFQEHNFCFFAAEVRDTRDFIGFVGLSVAKFEADFTPCVEIGWRLTKETWNKGYATEAAIACLKYARSQKAAARIYAFTAVDNLPSQRVMQKIGMQQTGQFPHPLIESNHPLQEHVLYTIDL